MEINSYSLQGRRESNEDYYFVLNNLLHKDEQSLPINFIGIYDGHGGKLVSKYIKDNLPKYILNDKEVLHKSVHDFKKHINLSYDNLQNKLKKYHPIAAKRCGTTALNGIFYKDKKNKYKLYVINTGDSRAILLDNNNDIIQLSQDHKPNSIKEKNRIEKLGGQIEYDGYDWRVNNLSLSRAFGDIDTFPLVTYKPEIKKYNINNNDKFIIFACDGLWDVLSNNTAANYVKKLRKKKFNGNYAKELAQYAYNKGSTDNITISILFIS